MNKKISNTNIVKIVVASIAGILLVAHMGISAITLDNQSQAIAERDKTINGLSNDYQQCSDWLFDTAKQLNLCQEREGQLKKEIDDTANSTTYQAGYEQGVADSETDYKIVIDNLITQTTAEYNNKPRELLDGWDSLEEFEAFLAQDDTDSLIFVTPDNLTGEKLCMFYALRVRLNAEKTGKVIFIDCFSPSDYELYFSLPAEGYWHSVLSVIVGDWVYFYDAQTDAQLPLMLKWWN